MTSRPALMRRGVIAVVCLASCLVTTPLSGQTVGGTFVGRVRDQSGGDAAVRQRVDHQRRDRRRDQVVTNADGLYSAPNLLPGPYEVTAASTGSTPRRRAASR